MLVTIARDSMPLRRILIPRAQSKSKYAPFISRIPRTSSPFHLQSKKNLLSDATLCLSTRRRGYQADPSAPPRPQPCAPPRPRGGAAAPFSPRAGATLLPSTRRRGERQPTGRRVLPLRRTRGGAAALFPTWRRGSQKQV